jgi:mannose-binding lectin 1
MVFTPRSLRSVAWSAFLLSTAQAQYVLDTLSFGHKGDSVSPNMRGVPHWWINGDGYVPHIMSDRVVLTPPWPGNTKGGIWAEETLNHGEWTAELSFRASGPERANGNLQLWYIKESQKHTGPLSMEEQSKFDGLVLLLDQHGGRGGSIRGFLNDGTIGFKEHPDPDTLAFGKCDYAFRNLGRLSVLKVHQAGGTFEVTIDGHECFKTDKVHLPTGYHFGITASSAENPDSFEVHKFIVSASTASVGREDPSKGHHEQPPTQQHQQPSKKKEPSVSDIPDMLSDVLAANIRNQEDQFADLHNRIQIINHKVNDIVHLLEAMNTKLDERHDAVMNHVAPSNDRSDAVLRNVEKIERMAMAIQRDLENKDYKDMLTLVHNAIQDSHNDLTKGLPVAMNQIVTSSRPKLRNFLLVVVAVQVSLFGAWQLYKKRRSVPKKYL